MKSSDKAAPADSTAPAGVKVKITSEAGHRHAGEKCPKDKVITVSEAEAKIIVETFKVGELVKGE